jgi:hydrogenase nickel incorporation protein HypA/HybF
MHKPMHEFSVTQSILAIVQEKAEAVGAAKINRVDLVIGELSGIVDDCVEFYWDYLTRDTIAAGSELSFRKPAARLRCRDCDTEFTPENGTWICPECQQPSLEIVAGRELYVESIEVD